MLESVRVQIEQLIARYEAVSVEAARLRQELRACEETVETLRKQNMELESEIETRKFAEAFSGGVVPADAKAKVDTLIKEIDMCISCLEDA